MSRNIDLYDGTVRREDKIFPDIEIRLSSKWSLSVRHKIPYILIRAQSPEILLSVYIIRLGYLGYVR